MRRLTFASVLASLFLLTLGAAAAQEGDATPDVNVSEDATIAFVDSQAAIAEHPAGAEADELEQEAQEEISGLREQLQSLAQQQQAEGLTSEENERYQALLTTLQSVQERYQADIQEAAQPAIEAVNAIIREIADANGIDVVLDITSASEGLVVYARDGLDITPQVLDLVRERHGGGDAE